MVLAAALSALVVAAVPVAVLMAVWSAVAMYRVLFPERPLPFVRDEAAERHAARARGEAVHVGFREIRDDMRLHVRELARPYHHAGGCSHGIPEAWIEDVYRRRN